MLVDLVTSDNEDALIRSFCAGFELEKWRCTHFANHLLEWVPDYALKEDELRVSHGNMFVRMNEAVARVYRSEHYEKRGEVGEICLHAICRDFFDTIPLAPRIFYKTASNDVVKSFDMVHIKYNTEDSFEIWLGEAKIYEDGLDAVSAAISSIRAHIDQGFLNREKLLLGGQIYPSIPRYDEVRRILSRQSSLDALFAAAVFPICIACDSAAAAGSKSASAEYIEGVTKEISLLTAALKRSKLSSMIRLILIYVPLGSKKNLLAAFDRKLKALQDD
ncbi:DUF1837 domain-containing protein [Ancylobacter dichloromethanicus]|uniref:Anti-bacteriophage protein A/HamA C-terminal domain-containing protein n=1 Tax=Ancylobacter dichloromethanicus TaxID=518825 RepID=A0A9W6J9E8_9HYPH|nr:DUF1837 domain-containing protein [Ancylobacter dichloromethanicus]MBS7555697.1 DUF1837 domain-containing protein [Ancylobacter dichloromethanicus]GLK73142.1 hypothetical protein GCM10017643_32580 [Ancylobacter dichloromethanicus]